MKVAKDSKIIEDDEESRGPEYFINQVEAFANGGSFDRDSMKRYLGLEFNEEVNFDEIHSPSEIFPILFTNISILDQGTGLIPYQTLDFLITLSKTKEDLSTFADSESISYFVNHINFQNPHVGHLLIRFINCLAEKYDDVITCALGNGILDQMSTFINSLNDESGDTCNLLPHVVDVMVYFCILTIKEEKDDAEVMQALWNFALVLVNHEMQSSAQPEFLGGAL